MKSIVKYRLWTAVIILAVGGTITGFHLWRTPDWWAAIDHPETRVPVIIGHPFDRAVMPANMPSPLIQWNTNAPGSGRWLVGFKTQTRRWLYEGVESPWHPPAKDWRDIKQCVGQEPIELVIANRQPANRKQVASAGVIRFTLAKENVEASLFYREVILPFQDAVKDPSRIRWRFGGIEGEEPPPIVLENLPVCGNCHSFSRDAKWLAMDVDYANSKGSYIITPTAPEMRLATSDIITWDDYRREDGQPTFGLLSQISPDGRYVLSTVKDHSVFVPKPDLAFSQLFFPLKGILAVYDREKKEFHSLPGADDPTLVQSNPVWSPDGQWVVFARNRAYELKNAKAKGKILLNTEECEEFLKDGKAFRYDLYRIPFNQGKGGKAEPLRGASGNGRSNYFPKYSPDGRWIVFCCASNYMLLQPDSELYLIPAEGGDARRLGCNLGRMNSWHSWSPDGRWLVFSSKTHSDYTQLYLARIDNQGEASPAVWLDRMVGTNRAANIPEFLPLPKNAISKIQGQFLDDYSFTRAGNEFYRAGEPDQAIENYRKALAMNPNNAMAHQRLGFLLFQVKNQHAEGLQHSQTAIRLESKNAFAHFDLGMAQFYLGDITNAASHLGIAAALLPNGFDSQYNVISLNYNWGQALYRLEQYSECAKAMRTVLGVAPKHADANYLISMALIKQGKVEDAGGFYDKAIQSKPLLARLPDYYDSLSLGLFQKSQVVEAQVIAEKAIALAQAAGRTEQAELLRQRVARWRASKDTSETSAANKLAPD
jgi:tetratricopeptide (TPR) repeat protein